jgi:hypothetical protein
MNKLQIIIQEILQEMAAGNFAGSGGAVGTSSGTPSQFSGSGVWAPNEIRLAQGIGGITRRNFPPLMSSKSKKTRKRKHKRKSKK